MQIEKKRICDINRAEYNPRIALQPGDSKYEDLAACIEQFGMVLPIVWNKRTNNVVGGHQRLTVLENRGAREVDVSVVDLDEFQEKVLAVALNKITGLWDEEKLVDILDTLGERAEETGFTWPEIEAMNLHAAALIDEDFILSELSRIGETFNLLLTFRAEDKKLLQEYVKSNGKTELIELILKKVGGANYGM